MKNYYKTLGISQNASHEEIKKAFRKLAVKYHPDKNRNHFVSEQFKEINEAKQVLLNDFKKFQYDCLLLDFLRENNSNANYSSTTKRQTRKKRFKALQKRNWTLIKKGALTTALFALVLFVSSDSFQIPEDDLSSNQHNKNNRVGQAAKRAINQPIVLASFRSRAGAEKKTQKTKTAKRTVTVAAITKPRQKKVSAEPGAKRPEGKQLNYVELTNLRMAEILADINTAKQKVGSGSNCVQILKSTKSNITNAFALAEYLRNSGYVISGREKIDNKISGIRIDATFKCIKVIVGTL